MDQVYKEARVRVEAPRLELSPLPISDTAERMPNFYYILIFLTLACSGLSLYLSFAA